MGGGDEALISAEVLSKVECSLPRMRLDSCQTVHRTLNLLCNLTPKLSCAIEANQSAFIIRLAK